MVKYYNANVTLIIDLLPILHWQIRCCRTVHHSKQKAHAALINHFFFLAFFKGPIILLEAGQSGSFTSRGNQDMHLVKLQQSIKDVFQKKNCPKNKRSIRASLR